MHIKKQAFPNEMTCTGLIEPELKNFILDKAYALCEANRGELLYLTLFGSVLYGTRVAGKSDVDVRGLYLPSIESLALGETSGSLRFSTGDGKNKNAPGDVDLDLWPLQYWLLKLLPAGDTGALDILFSPSHRACILYRDSRLDALFVAPLRLIDTVNSRAYAKYSIGQAKKYGIKGSRLGALRSVLEFMEKHFPAPARQEQLGNCLQDILETCGDGRFCALREIHGRPSLQLCGKLYDGAIRLTEFRQRLEADMERYGARAREAEQNRGLDFKALSHAMRALMQMEELLTTGAVTFPLKRNGELLAIKEGRFAWKEVEAQLLERLKAVDDLRATAPFHGVPDAEFARHELLACYDIRSRRKQALSPDSGNGKPIFAEGFGIPEATLEAIQSRLEAAEGRYGVKVLYACESGSRGWNLASRDSDFDVRFIYVHDRDWYLSVAPEGKPDTLDLGLEDTPVGELDINGWELRKALKLFRKSNAPLLEWLSSPLVYREKGFVIQRLREMIPVCFSPLAVWHHYRGLTEKSRARYQAESPSIKMWFYMLRPLFCMRWIESGLGCPPMRFDRVMESVVTDPALQDEIRALVRMKREGAEQERFVPSSTLEAYVRKLLQEKSESPLPAAGRQQADLDAVFREALD